MKTFGRIIGMHFSKILDFSTHIKHLCLKAVIIVNFSTAGCDERIDTALRNDFQVYHLSIETFCNNKKHYPLFSTTIEGIDSGWRAEVYSVAVPAPKTSGETFFIDRSGSLFELNFPESGHKIQSLSELPPKFIVGTQSPVPTEFDWTKPSKLPVFPSSNVAVAEFLNLRQKYIVVLMADGSLIKLKARVPCKVLSPFFDEKRAAGLTTESLEPWVVDEIIGAR